MIAGLFRPLYLLVILGVAFFVFGPKKLPELGKGIREGIRSFKDVLNGDFAPREQRTGEDLSRVQNTSIVK